MQSIEMSECSDGRKPHFLWISPRWPFPSNDGARMCTAALIRGLTALGATVDLVAFVGEDDAAKEEDARSALGVRNITIVPKGPRSVAGYARAALSHPSVPFSVSPFIHPVVQQAVRTAFDRDPDVRIVHDGLHAAAWMFLGSSQVPRKNLIFRPHNVERDLWFQAAGLTRNPLKALALRIQGALIGHLEARVTQASGHVLAVSDADADRFRRLAPQADVSTAPIGLWIEPPVAPESRHDNGVGFLFVGRLDWQPNREGLKWLLDHVWPVAVAARPDISLTIVGSGDGSWLATYRSLPGVRMLGRVDDVGPYYEECTACVVPVFFGSGTRVKVIEASLLQRACVGTQLGVDGVGLVAGETFIRAETAQEWIEALRSVTPGAAADMGRQAHQVVAARFDARRVAADVLRRVSQHESVTHVAAI